MKLKALAVLAGLGAACIACDRSAGEYLGLTHVYKPNPFGIDVCNVYAQFDHSDDRLLAVAGTADAPMMVDVWSGGTLYQHTFGGDTAPQQEFIDLFPSLAYDTFGTIGVKVNDGTDSTTLTPFWPGFGAIEVGAANLAWFVTPDDAQAAPDPGGRVLLGQFSTADGFAPRGRFLILVISDGEPVLRYTGDCCFLSDSPCTEGDLTFNNIVGIADFLRLLAEWGPCPPEDFCWADLNNDGVVNVVDFLQQLGLWTAPGPEPLPSVNADLNGDGVTDVVDLLTLLSCWSPPGGGCAPADLDGDGVVGTRDLLIMLANWG
jgi:hypothetical protein